MLPLHQTLRLRSRTVPFLFKRSVLLIFAVTILNLVVMTGFEPVTLSVWRRKTTIVLHYHIETHRSGIRTPRSPISFISFLPTRRSNMFLYGRGVRERSEFYRLKAGYFTLKFHPHMVHSVGFEPTPHWLRVKCATVNATSGWIRNCFLLRAI